MRTPTRETLRHPEKDPPLPRPFGEPYPSHSDFRIGTSICRMSLSLRS